MSIPPSDRDRLESLRDAIFFAGYWGTKLAGEVASLEKAYSIESRNCDPIDFLVPTTDPSGRTLAEPLDESSLRATLRIVRERCVWEVLELRKAVDDAFAAVREASDLVNDPAAAPEKRLSLQLVRELQALRGAILVGHEPTSQPSALPMIRAGVPDAIRRAVAPLADRFDYIKSLLLERYDGAPEPDVVPQAVNPASAVESPTSSDCQSSFGVRARQNIASISGGAEANRQVVPKGGGSTKPPKYLDTVRSFVGMATASLAEIGEWHVEDGRFCEPDLNPGWKERLAAVHNLYRKEIATLGSHPSNLPSELGWKEWLRAYYPDSDVRIMLVDNCGYFFSLLWPPLSGPAKFTKKAIHDAQLLLKPVREWASRFEPDSAGDDRTPQNSVDSSEKAPDSPDPAVPTGDPIRSDAGTEPANSEAKDDPPATPPDPQRPVAQAERPKTSSESEPKRLAVDNAAGRSTAPQPFSYCDDDLTILSELAARGVRLRVSALDGKAGMPGYDRLADRLKAMEEATPPLVHRPSGPRSGYAITPDGRGELERRGLMPT